MPQFPARIHVLFARDARYGVVLRRGPAKQVATIGWDRATDSFVLGQWLKGRIYERRSDLSPDGKHLIYFAMNGKWTSETKGSWTAISRAPYLKAIGLWAKSDCWQGGGLFVDNDCCCLNDSRGSQQALIVPTNLKLSCIWPFPGGVGAECLGVYFPRLLRDGWRLTSEPSAAENASADFWVFEKPAPGEWLLRKYAFATLDHPAGKGCYYDRHELLHKASGERINGSGLGMGGRGSPPDHLGRGRKVVCRRVEPNWTGERSRTKRLQPAGIRGPTRALLGPKPLTFPALPARI